MSVLIWVQTVCKSYQQTSKVSKTTFRNTIRVSNSLDPDQDRHSVGPDLVQTVCKSYQRMSKVKVIMLCVTINLHVMIA